jgi:isopropylmalate/homocitrate/citramalate synthase
MYDHFTDPPRPDAPVLRHLLDVTLRDGGFEVGFHWDAETIAQVPASLIPLGVDVVELGYLEGVPLEHDVSSPGLGAFITPDLVAAAAAMADGGRLAAMIHPTALGTGLDLAAYARSGLAMVRLVYHPSWADDIQHIAKQAQACGLQVTVNIALASRYRADELAEHAAAVCRNIAPDVLYVADTCGAMYPDQVGALFARLREETEGELGFHAHDFLTLAYANALAAAEAGATYFDSSLLGLGRGGGNLSTELTVLRHRVPRPVTAGDADRFLACRRHLAERAGREVRPLTPVVCGTLNLTPVEEGALYEQADTYQVDHDTAALLLAAAGVAPSSLGGSGTTPAWLPAAEAGTG